MSSTSTLGTSSTTPVMATVPAPFTGGSQHLWMVRSAKSERPMNRALMLEPEDLQHTVIASAFYEGRRMAIPTTMEAPHDYLELPPLSRSDLREQVVYDVEGKVIGHLLHVPGLYVQANQVLMNIARRRLNYNYALALTKMAQEAAFMLCSTLRHSVLRVRERPGAMGHVQAMKEIGPNQVGMTIGFAEKLLAEVKKQFPDLDLPSVWSLDGFPCWGVRFPLANEHGIQAMHLKILPGYGRFMGVNPWNLGMRYLGDEDGDSFFIRLRVEELLAGDVSMQHSERIRVDRSVGAIHSQLSLQNAQAIETIPGIDEKTLEKNNLQLDSTDLRMEWIESADTRQHVAVYTMAIGWWCARVLAASGTCGPVEAHQKAYNALEWFMENAMDARKGGSALTEASFNGYEFMRTLMRGGKGLPTEQLRMIGVPEHAMEVLETAWAISDQNLRGYCERSPIYVLCILNRNDMERCATGTLTALQQMGVAPQDLYRTIINDLTCVAPLVLDEEN